MIMTRKIVACFRIAHIVKVNWYPLLVFLRSSGNLPTSLRSAAMNSPHLINRRHHCQTTSLWPFTAKMISIFCFALCMGCVPVLYNVCGLLIRKYFIVKLTALNELSDLHKSTRKSDKLRGNAVICGGSMAGLLAARVCSYHFENVIIVESEEWVTTQEGYTGSHRKELADKRRSHVAQYKAAHYFQPFLVATLVKWFPNLKEECERLGGRIVPHMLPAVFSGLPFPLPAYPKDDHPMALQLNRPGLETLLRRLVMNSCKNVKYMSGIALGLEKTIGGNTLTAVHVRTSEMEQITLPAILIIDCTGSSSAGLRWLRSLAIVEGNDAAVYSLDNLRLTYSPKQSYRTCDFDVPPGLVPRLMEVGFPSDWDSSGVIFVNMPDPKMDNKVVMVLRKDNHHLEFLLAGWSVTDVITNINDIRSYLSSLRVYKPLPDWIGRVLNVFEENDVPYSIGYARLNTAAYIRYNLYGHMPSNFIAMGDSIMRLNPIRAAGCTKACIEALSLNGLLSNCCSGSNGSSNDRLPEDFSKKFHKLQASRIEPIWNMSKAQDYSWSTTVPSKGDNLLIPKIQGVFDRLVIQTALKDKDFNLVLISLQGFLIPPTDLFSLKNLLKLLKAKLFDASPML